MDNHMYDLVTALSEKAEGVWAYDKYLEDSKDCSECAALWEQLKEEDSKHIEKIKQILASHFQKGTIK